MRNSDFYDEQFDHVYNSGIIGFLKSIVHRILEFPFLKTYSATILELGAGEGFHRRFVTSGFHKYVETDISERANTSNPGEKFLLGKKTQKN